MKRRLARAAILAMVLLAAVGTTAPGARAEDGPGGGGPALDDPLPLPGQYVYVEELPEVIMRIEPRCPELAREAGVSGTVMVQVLVGKDGRVKDTRIVESIPMLDAAAVAAVRQWVFKPAQSNGYPVAVWVAIPIMFGPTSAPPAAGKLDDSRRAFVQEIAALQADGPRVPSDADSALRRHIVQDALALDPRPLVPPEARAHLERGRHARERCACRDSTLRAVDEFTAALYEAPWWGPSLRQLGDALLRLDRKLEALACLELYLLAEPGVLDQEKVQKQIAALRKDRAGRH
jgi:TonB family protein